MCRILVYYLLIISYAVDYYINNNLYTCILYTYKLSLYILYKSLYLDIGYIMPIHTYHLFINTKIKLYIDIGLLLGCSLLLYLFIAFCIVNCCIVVTFFHFLKK